MNVETSSNVILKRCPNTVNSEILPFPRILSTAKNTIKLTIVVITPKNRYDSISYVSSFPSTGICRNFLKNAIENAKDGYATVFGYFVEDPQRYGVAELDSNGNCVGIEEKPQNPKSDICVTGLYYYPNDVIDKAKQVKPSARGELEITTLNQMYINEGRMKIEILNRGFAWFDTGTFDSLNEASNFVRAIEKRQGLLVGSPEETAYRNKWINKADLYNLALPMQNNDYGKKLLKIANKN